MRDRVWGIVSRGSGARKPSAKGLQPLIENLEGRVVLNASLAPIPNISVPATLGYQVPLDGSGSGASSQTYTVTSSNPNIKATVASGEFVTLNVTHTAANSSDISFSGPITFQLFGDLTPYTASEIATFVQDGFYNGKIFHRVASGFNSPDGTPGYIVQGGSATGTGAGASGQPGTPFPDEFNSQLAFTGQYQVAMANSGPDTNDTQFFFTTASPQSLDFGYTIFAQVVSGQNLIQDMTKVALTSGTTTPINPITISSATLSTTNPDGVLHIDTTGAIPGETATITVKATDPSTNTTATQTFTVNTVADPAAPERPYVTTVYPITNDIVAGLNQTIGKGQVDTFQIPGVAVTPGDQLTYEVGSSFTPSTTPGTPGTLNPVPTTQGTANVSANGIVTFTPASGFSGNVNLLVGVRDNTIHNPSAVSPSDPANYQWHNLTVTVNSSSTVVPLKPIALPLSQTAKVNVPTTFSLTSQNPNTGSTQTLTYTITQQPSHGSITGFNATSGQLTYTPEPNFTGYDRFQYTVTASGGGQSTLVSLPSTVTIDVAGSNNSGVRVIGTALIVTPPPASSPRTKAKNTIDVTEVGASDPTTATLNVTINGVLSSVQPLVSSIDQIIVFGGKSSDTITIDPSVTVSPITLDGGHGGTNVLTAGSTTTVEHGWFGHNTLIGGTGPNELIGRRGHVRFKPTKTTTEIFAGVPKGLKNGKTPQPPGGTFYRYHNGHIVAIPTPRPGPFAHVGNTHTKKK